MNLNLEEFSFIVKKQDEKGITLIQPLGFYL